MDQYHIRILKAASDKFGIFDEDLLQTHYSEHSFIGSYRLKGIKVFLRVTNSSHKRYEKILGEVQWVDFLVTRGLSVCRPLHSKDGNLAERITVENESFTVVCYEEAQGHPVEEKDKNDTLSKRMGMFMGKMHVAAKQYVHEEPVTRRPEWSTETDKVLSIELPQSEKDIVHRYVELRKYISGLPKNRAFIRINSCGFSLRKFLYKRRFYLSV